MLKSKAGKAIGDFAKLWLSFCLSLSHTRRSFGKPSVLALLLLPVVGFCGFGSTPDYTHIEKAIKEGKLAAARQELENRVQADPSDYQAQLLLGIVLDEQREPSEAVKHLKMAERLRPGDPSIWENTMRNWAI